MTWWTWASIPSYFVIGILFVRFANRPGPNYEPESRASSFWLMMLWPMVFLVLIIVGLGELFKILWAGKVGSAYDFIMGRK